MSSTVSPALAFIIQTVIMLHFSYNRRYVITLLTGEVPLFLDIFIQMSPQVYLHIIIWRRKIYVRKSALIFLNISGIPSSTSQSEAPFSAAGVLMFWIPGKGRGKMRKEFQLGG